MVEFFKTFIKKVKINENFNIYFQRQYYEDMENPPNRTRTLSNSFRYVKIMKNQNQTSFLSSMQNESNDLSVIMKNEQKEIVQIDKVMEDILQILSDVIKANLTVEIKYFFYTLKKISDENRINFHLLASFFFTQRLLITSLIFKK